MDIQDPFSLIFRIQSVTKDLCKYWKGYLVDAILIKEKKNFILDLRPFEYRKMTRHQNGPMSSWQWFYHSVGVTTHVRYINILTLHGSGAFVTNFYFGVVFYILKSPLAMKHKRNFTNLQLPPKILGVMLDYWLIYRTWPIWKNMLFVNWWTAHFLRVNSMYCTPAWSLYLYMIQNQKYFSANTPYF